MQPATILVVEDELIVAMDLQGQLIAMGYSVPAVAITGQGALEKTAKIHPDLVLMDIRLKGDMDGIEAAEQIRASHGVPVVYVTAYSDEDTLARARITEPRGYIVKPLNERTLCSTLERALQSHETGADVKQAEV
jgi:CheY-like chemotaxis protein